MLLCHLLFVTNIHLTNPALSAMVILVEEGWMGMTLRVGGVQIGIAGPPKNLDTIPGGPVGRGWLVGWELQPNSTKKSK